MLLWWSFALIAVLLAPLAVLLSRSIGGADATLLAVATATGVRAAVVQFVVGAALMTCCLEFVGPFERTGWKLAERLTPIAYVLWSLWLIATWVALIA